MKILLRYFEVIGLGVVFRLQNLRIDQLLCIPLYQHSTVEIVELKCGGNLTKISLI